jgi:hypothetical protein
MSLGCFFVKAIWTPDGCSKVPLGMKGNLNATLKNNTNQCYVNDLLRLLNTFLAVAFLLLIM